MVTKENYTSLRQKICGTGPCRDNDCPLNPMVCFLYTDENMAILEKHLKAKGIEETEPTTPDTPTTAGQIVHPNHYNREGALECWDEMILVFGIEAVKSFCEINTWKYRYRAGSKDGESRDKDMKKSDQYMLKLKELSEKS